MKKFLLLLCAVFLSTLWAPVLSMAQDDPGMPHQSSLNKVEVLPAKSVVGMPEQLSDSDTTHPALRLTPEKSELIRLDTSASSIIVGNPNHLSVIAETPRLLILVPHMAGATHFTVLDNDSNVIMSRHVLVGGQKESYVRIRRSCASSDSRDCQATQVYYCPDMCHAIDGASPQNTANSAQGQPQPNVNEVIGNYRSNEDLGTEIVE